MLFVHASIRPPKATPTQCQKPSGDESLQGKGKPSGDESFQGKGKPSGDVSFQGEVKPSGDASLQRDYKGLRMKNHIA